MTPKELTQKILVITNNSDYGYINFESVDGKEIFKLVSEAVKQNASLTSVVKNEANFKTLSLLGLQLKALREDIPKHLKPYKSSDVDVEMYLMKIKAMQSKVYRIILTL